MPGFDRTGPQGMGPMTGGCRGYCQPGQPAGYGNTVADGYGYGPGRGFGRGAGRGRGFGRRFGSGRGRGHGGFPAGVVPADAMSRDEETEMLRAQARYAEDMLNAINKRLEALEKGDTTTE